MAEYQAAIHYGNTLGTIVYDGGTKSAKIELEDPEGRALIEKYLATKQVVAVPHDSLTDFTEETIDPLADERSFQLALTRIWEATGGGAQNPTGSPAHSGVYVDWSRPPEFVRRFPTLDSLPKGGAYEEAQSLGIA